MTYFCVYIVLRLCRTRLQCGWMVALCGLVPWQVYSSGTLSCTAADMSTGLWPFVQDSGLFLLPCVHSISAEIMCSEVFFFFFLLLFYVVLPTLFDFVAWRPFGFSVGGSDSVKKLEFTVARQRFGLWLKYVKPRAKKLALDVVFFTAVWRLKMSSRGHCHRLLSFHPIWRFEATCSSRILFCFHNRRKLLRLSYRLELLKKSWSVLVFSNNNHLNEVNSRKILIRKSFIRRVCTYCPQHSVEFISQKIWIPFTENMLTFHVRFKWMFSFSFINFSLVICNRHLFGFSALQDFERWEMTADSSEDCASLPQCNSIYVVPLLWVSLREGWWSHISTHSQHS